jgi:PadR family transcriptional regulator PadR
MSKQQEELLQGTLDMLVMKILVLEPMHGWGMTQRIEQITDNVLSVQQGSLYPALVRLSKRGWITSEWRKTENNRRARYYSLTAKGRKQLEREAESWERLSAAIGQIMRAVAC